MAIEAFTAGLLLIVLSELGDKPFFIVSALSGRHWWRLVFSGVLVAVSTTTLLAVMVGQAISLLPETYVDFGAVALLFTFGLKLLYDASQMSARANEAELREAVAVVNEAEIDLPKQQTPMAIVVEAFFLTFLAEWGNRTQIATIALAACKDPTGVILGAIAGHCIWTAIAVFRGRVVVEEISQRMVTAIGGSLFIFFGAIALWRV
ncbi:MAG: TMEM165/GDT1 family protein [Cyanosarcina radialis HA8281-LM2]|jgi:putative Ca2+/H+ antiporter (TMEM165/GDT1 family)|nr:TMEM165/GDT1 family protein [Cyanosarcina radialis HA8281-LM2]